MLWTCAACGAQVARLLLNGRVHYFGAEAEAGDWRAWVEAATGRENARAQAQALAGAVGILSVGALAYWGTLSVLAAQGGAPQSGARLLALPTLADADVEAEARDLYAVHVPAYVEAGQRIQDVGWRMLVTAADECTGSQPATGLSFAGEHGFPDEPAYTEALGGAPAAIAFVPAGSPAHAAGLRRGDRLVAVGAADVSGFTEVKGVVDALVAAAGQGGPLSLTVVRGGERVAVTVTPVRACPQRLLVSPSGRRNALTDRETRITVLRGSAGPEVSDDELATIVGHEIGHMVAEARGEARSPGLRAALRVLRAVGAPLPDALKATLNAADKRVELVSDAVGARLAAKAGYDPAAAVRSERRFGLDNMETVRSGGESHPGSAQRIVNVRAVVQGLLRDADIASQGHAAGR